MRVTLDYRPALSFPQSGIGRQNIALEQAINDVSSVDLRLVTPAPADHSIRQTAACPLWSTASIQGQHRLPLRLRFEGLFLPRYLREQAIDIHINNFNMGLPLGCKPGKTRYVLQLHDLFQLTQKNHHGSPIKERIYRYTDALSIRYSIWRADRIWTPSQFTANEVTRYYPWAQKKLRVLPNLVNDAPAETSLSPSLNIPARFWLAVGTREPRKNIPWFINQWMQARQTNAAIPDLALVGDSDVIPQNQRQLPGLHFYNHLQDQDLYALYRRAERLWQPSFAEGFGLPIVEALSVGTAVAVATGSALDEVAPKDAPRFASDDGPALIKLMHELAAQPLNDREKAIAYAQRFQRQAYNQRVIELLKELAP